MINDFKKAISLLPNYLKIRFILLIFFIFIGTFLEMLSIALLIPILNILVGSTENIISFLNEKNLGFLIDFITIEKILYFFLIIYFVKSIFRLFLVHFQNHFIFTFFTILINKLYKEYILKNYFFHIKTNTPKLIRNLSTEIHQCSIGYMGALTNILLEILIILGLMSFLFYYKPNEILLFILLTGFVSFIIVKFLNIKSKQLGKNRQRFSLINLKTIVSSLGGIKEIKVNNKEKEIINKFSKNSEDLKINNYIFQVLQQIPKILLELIIVFSIILLLIYLLKTGMPKEEIIILFGLMIGIFSRVMPSINKLSTAYINLNYYKPALDLIHKEINNIKNSKGRYIKETKSLIFDKSIKINNLSFAYGNSKSKILENVNLTINKGESIGVFGESGSGKSTLIDIIVGLLEPQKGKVLVDNVDIKKQKKKWFSKIGYVPQNVYLNDDTVKNNIFFYENKNQNNMSRMKESVKISQLKKISLKKKVGERGVQISGGQKQRVGLARALYKQSEILILDEATSSLDKENEENFLKDVFKLKSKKTLIIISHKKSVVEKCDRVITINNKKIKEIHKNMKFI